MIPVAPDAIQLRQHGLLLPDLFCAPGKHAAQIGNADHILHGFTKNGVSAGASQSSINSLSMRSIIIWKPACSCVVMNSPIALRTGGFQSDRAVYRAMARAKLPAASNIAMGVNPPAEDALRLTDGRHFIEGVLELPAMSYRTPLSSGARTFAVTATSSSEMQHILRQAHAAGISPVIVLTHPFEFIKKRDFRSLWIVRIGAACRASEMSYSRFMSGLKKAGIELNRKTLAEMALNDPPAFSALVSQAKSALESEPKAA